LHYRDSGIRNLAVIAAAESGLVGVALTPNGAPASTFIADLLAILAVAALLLSLLAVISCRRSFIAEMESLYVMAMVTWAMGLTYNVEVDQRMVDLKTRPQSVDRTLYARRWVEGAFKHKSCDDFVGENLAKWWNTYFLTKLTIIVFGACACALGFLGMRLVSVHPK